MRQLPTSTASASARKQQPTTPSTNMASNQSYKTSFQQQASFRHLLQSTVSIFARGPISELLGEDCCNSEDILDGNIDIARIAKEYGHLEEATTLLLKEMRRRMDEAGKPVVMNWTFGKDEFRAAFSKARNNTAPGFSGLPMIYWKAICEDDNLC